MALQSANRSRSAVRTIMVIAATLGVGATTTGVGTPATAAPAQACATEFPPSEPTGTPKVISTENELVWISADSARGAHDYIQSVDLDLDDCLWSPILNFTGTYDGGGHRIVNLTVIPASPANRVGFIARAVGASVSNLTLDTVKVANSLLFAGALAAEMVNSSLSAITVTNVDIGEPGNATNQVGGIVGKFEVNFSSSIAATMLRSDGIVRAQQYVGGVFGEVNVDSGTLDIDDVEAATDVASLRTAGGFAGIVQVNTGSFAISDITTSGTVSSSAAPSSGSSTVGGAVGYVYGPGSSMTRIVSTGTVNAGDTYAGGLIGYVAGLDLHQSRASGSVTGTNFVGGLVGMAETAGHVTMSAVSASGAVSGDDDVGGLLGYLDAYANSATICDAAATGAVSGVDKVAGLIGRIVDAGTFVTIHRGYASGSLTGTTRTGGAVGVATGAVTTSGIVWDADVSGTATSATDAVGLATAAMTSLSTYTNRGWSIASASDPAIAAGTVTWSINDGASTPSLVPGAMTPACTAATATNNSPVSALPSPPPPPPTTTTTTIPPTPSTTSTPPSSTVPPASVPELEPEIEIRVVDGQTLEAITGTVRLELAVTNEFGVASPVDPQGRLVVAGDRRVRVRATGFAPDSIIEVMLYSTPRLLDTLMVDDLGHVDAMVDIPPDIAVGEHTLESRAVTGEGRAITVALPLVVTAPIALPSTGTTTSIGGLALVLLGLALAASSRRHRRHI